MALYLNILSVVLLALVAGLLLALYFQLKVWRSTNREAPLLAEKLAEAMLSARKGLADLKHELVAQGPDLNRLLTEGGKLRVEMQFLLQRGAQLAERLDITEHSRADYGRQGDDVDEDMPVMRLSPAAQAVVEQVAGANGQAIGTATVATRPTANGDPLEELLANLQTTPVEPLRKSGKRKRVGPVTQAELDLQQSLQNNAQKRDAA